MRLPRARIENCCIHVTHRCHERVFLLGTDIDRRQYVKRLWQASRRQCAIRFLDYVVTSNHIHLLVWVPRTEDLSEAMKWLQGTFAGDYNRRVGREGAFWRGRYHSTLVETGRHLDRCLLYLDMNMVRAGAVAHPRDWRFGGYQELSGARKRYRIVDQNRLLRLLSVPDMDSFRRWHEAAIADQCRLAPAKIPREPHWSGAFAVGSRNWLEGIVGSVPQTADYITPAQAAPNADADGTCVLKPPQSLCRRIWEKLTGGK